MASSILNSDDGVISGTSGLKSTGGDDGVLVFQSKGTETARITATGNVGIGTTSPGSYGPSGSRLAVVNTTSGEVCNLSVVNNSTDTFEGGGILLGNSGLTTGYDATYLYHHKFSASGNDYSAFNISQRKVDGTYIANIWNVDYKNSALAWYAPNSGTQTMGMDSSGNLLFNSGYGSVATAYGCRAWVNFQGSGTVTIREDGNVSSITDNGTGAYTVNFTTAMPDSNYAFSVSGGNGRTGGTNVQYGGPAASAPSVNGMQIETLRGTTLGDPEDCSVIIFR